MVQSKIQAIASELKAEFFERERIIDAALAAMLSKQHMLQLGVPGTAKSLVTNALCKRIEGATYFEWLLTRFSVPEELFGQISLKGIQQDEYRRITDGKLPCAHIVFLDEIFKGNAAILNSLLTAINERAFDNGKKRETIPLVSMFGASNELPEEQELDALFDRFILRFDVNYIQDGANWEALMRNGVRAAVSASTPTTLTLDELVQAQNEVTQVDFPNDVIATMRNIKMTLEREGLVASDRRWKQTVRVLQAWAWLHGESSVRDQHLELLCDMLWKEPEQRVMLVSKVLSITNPLDLEAVEIYDNCKDVYSRFQPNSSTSTEEITAKLKSALNQIDSKLSYADASKTAKMREVRDSIKGWYKEVLGALEL